MDQNCFTSTTLCLRKNATVPLFLYSSLKKWTNFHNLWYAQSWKYLTLIIRHLSTIPENVTMLPCEMRNLTRLKLYDFLPKFDNYKNSWLLCCPELQFQTTNVKGAPKSYYCLCWHTLPIFLRLICHHAMLSFSPCLNKELMPACMDIMHVMLFHCI